MAIPPIPEVLKVLQSVAADPDQPAKDQALMLALMAILMVLGQIAESLRSR